MIISFSSPAKITGYYIFDVTSAVERWIAQSAKPKQQLIAIEKEKIPVKIKRGDREYQLGVLPEGMYYYLDLLPKSCHSSEIKGLCLT